MSYDGINPQTIRTPPEFNENAFSRVNARETAGKLEQVIAGIDETTDVDVGGVDVRGYQDTIAAHEHGDKRLYAAIHPSTTTSPTIQKISTTPRPIQLEAETHAYVVAQPQIGSAYTWSGEDEYETEQNKEKLFGHVDDMVREWIDEDYVSAKADRRRGEPPGVSVDHSGLNEDDVDITTGIPGYRPGPSSLYDDE